MVAPQITDETLGLAAHHAIESCANGTPNSSAIGFKPSTFFSTSSTSDRDARFYNTWEKVGKEKQLLSNLNKRGDKNFIPIHHTTIKLQPMSI